MPVRANLHGKLTVEVPVPKDVQKTLGVTKLSRRVPDGMDAQDIERELQDKITRARGLRPLRIVIELAQACPDSEYISRVTDRLKEALRQPDAKIKFEKPRE